MHLVFRSHLEKPPDKYIMPNPEQAVRNITELSILKPKISQLAVHEYPNEHVIVIEGENLWFSYKICLDEKGENQCDIATPADSTTRASIEFHLSNSHSTLSSGKQVKVALYTHFAKPIRQSIYTKKVALKINKHFIYSLFLCVGATQVLSEANSTCQAHTHSSNPTGISVCSSGTARKEIKI